MTNLPFPIFYLGMTRFYPNRPIRVHRRPANSSSLMPPGGIPAGIERRGRREQAPLSESSAAAAGSKPYCWNRAPRPA